MYPSANSTIFTDAEHSMMNWPGVEHTSGCQDSYNGVANPFARLQSVTQEIYY